MKPHEIILDLPGAGGRRGSRPPSWPARGASAYPGFARLWLPDKPKRAALYIHGIQSHGEWFEASAERLAEEGCAVLLPDRRGSGRNEIDRGHAVSPRQLVDDLRVGLMALSARTGIGKVTVVAVSWGGKLALALARRVPAQLERLVLVAPGLFPQVDISLGKKLAVVSRAIRRSSKRFDVPLDAPELFTGNPDRIAYIRDDPLGVHQVTGQFLVTSRRLDWEVRRYGRRPPAIPLRVFLAGRDRIIDNEQTRRFVRGLKLEDRALIEHPDAFHTLEFEPDPNAYLRDLVEVVRGKR